MQTGREEGKQEREKGGDCVSVFCESEMSELDSEYVNYTEKRGERKEVVVEIYDSVDAGKGHDLKEEKEAADVTKTLQTEPTGTHVLKCICIVTSHKCHIFLKISSSC